MIKDTYPLLGTVSIATASKPRCYICTYVVASQLLEARFAVKTDVGIMERLTCASKVTSSLPVLCVVQAGNCEVHRGTAGPRSGNGCSPGCCL